MNIAICDDEIESINRLKKILLEIEKQKNYELTIEIYLSGKELLENITGLDAVFLDIDMPEVDGIEIGNQIMKVKKQCVLVMATGREDRYREAYHIGARDFVTKPFIKEEIEESLNIIHRMQIGNKEIVVYKDKKEYRIYEKNIKYIIAYSGRVDLSTDLGDFHGKENIKEIYEKLDREMFVKVRRDVIVNLSKIENCQDGTIYIEKNIINVSRRCRKEFELKYMNYDLNYK